MVQDEGLHFLKIGKNVDPQPQLKPVPKWRRENTVEQGLREMEWSPESWEKNWAAHMEPGAWSYY